MNTASYHNNQAIWTELYPEDTTGRVEFKKEPFLDLHRLALRQMFLCFV